MRLLSVNVGIPQRDGDGRAKTGVVKVPVDLAQVGEFGLEGDAVCNTKHHGGKDRVVYLAKRARTQKEQHPARVLAKRKPV